MVRRDFVERKIKLIQEDLANLEAFKGLSFDELAEDSIKYAAAERYLERIITRAIDVNMHLISEVGKGSEAARTYSDAFFVLADLGVYPKTFAESIADSAGLRNILVHEYDTVDKKKVYASVYDALSEYTQYCDFILQFLEQLKRTHRIA
ncbi:MAG: hypothetical protein A3C90_02895 [Candidatus Magasanikbacteria bacterium RIFCSPHIGHO2_02_FULL_51_14]|uniref:DUF86 domain-containing protein n=1 Tax=Candidatus Magasanikbacteria bacterium RIFCSPHIGHO2_02_FULL_51_14 TaxID=1798683 RepID=A0A1F6MGH7_9BACT|nr:MAG: hypothetical protein A3C90_02895 [Candidatus Magasanikbacteria bacterium RIFCSPHIGHO2_02_FULL_51_14]